MVGPGIHTMLADLGYDAKLSLMFLIHFPIIQTFF